MTLGLDARKEPRWTIVFGFAGGGWAAYQDDALYHEGWDADDVLDAVAEAAGPVPMFYVRVDALDEDPCDSLAALASRVVHVSRADR